MNKTTLYFTCGQQHRHIINGNCIWDKDSVIQVTADTAADARAYNRFGDKWGTQYDSLEDLCLGYYPKGIVLKVDC